jgi:hypothetical protein
MNRPVVFAFYGYLEIKIVVAQIVRMRDNHIWIIPYWFSKIASAPFPAGTGIPDQLAATSANVVCKFHVTPSV